MCIDRLARSLDSVQGRRSRRPILAKDARSTCVASPTFVGLAGWSRPTANKRNLLFFLVCPLRALAPRRPAAIGALGGMDRLYLAALDRIEWPAAERGGGGHSPLSPGLPVACGWLRVGGTSKRSRRTVHRPLSFSSFLRRAALSTKRLLGPTRPFRSGQPRHSIGKGRGRTVGG